MNVEYLFKKSLVIKSLEIGCVIGVGEFVNAAAVSRPLQPQYYVSAEGRDSEESFSALSSFKLQGQHPKRF